MACSETLATRIRNTLEGKRGIAEKKMFGGVGFLLKGNMLIGVWKNSLIVRLGLDAFDDALLEPYVRNFDITGKPMKGWVMVEQEGLKDNDQLVDWIARALTFVRTLPAK